MELWRRFPPRMRKAISTSLDEAGRAGREQVGAADLLLAIAKDAETAGAYVFEHAGVPRERLIEALKRNGNGHGAPARPRPWADQLSAEAMHVLDVAADE